MIWSKTEFFNTFSHPFRRFCHSKSFILFIYFRRCPFVIYSCFLEVPKEKSHAKYLIFFPSRRFHYFYSWKFSKDISSGFDLYNTSRYFRKRRRIFSRSRIQCSDAFLRGQFTIIRKCPNRKFYFWGSTRLHQGICQSNVWISK